MSAIRIVAKTDSPLSKKEKVIKKKEKKQKKMSKKESKRSARLTKKFEKSRENVFADKFMHTKLKNIILLNEEKYSAFTGKFTKKRFDINNKSRVLVNAGNGILFSIPVVFMKELTKIKYIEIDAEYSVFYDGDYECDDEDPEPSMFLSKHECITTLNKLCYYLIIRMGMIQSLQLYQSGEGWYSNVEFDETFNILYNDGTSEKITGREFLERYNFYKFCGYNGDIES